MAMTNASFRGERVNFADRNKDTKPVMVTNPRATRPLHIPDGVFEGTWQAYLIKFTAHGEEYVADVNEPIAGPEIPCQVTCCANQLTVKASG